MATVGLAKPATLGTAVLQIYDQSSTNTRMNLKLQACDIQYVQEVDDTTGNTDAFRTAEGNSLLGGTIALQGLLLTDLVAGVSPDRIGIENMFSTTENTSRMRWSVGLASGIFLQGKMIVRECRVRWIRTAATIQLTIVGQITDTAASTTEATAAYT
jgi:hypothetical protein